MRNKMVLIVLLFSTFGSVSLSIIISDKPPAQDTCYLTPKGTDYTGKVSVTKDGKACLKWADHPNQVFYKKAIPECLSGLFITLCCLTQANLTLFAFFFIQR